MSRGPDASTLLQRALLRAAHAAGCTIAIAETHVTRWASATFTGAQHRLLLKASDDAAFDRWIGALPDADLVLRGHLVADVVVLSVARADGDVRATVEALTVED